MYGTNLLGIKRRAQGARTSNFFIDKQHVWPSRFVARNDYLLATKEAAVYAHAKKPSSDKTAYVARGKFYKKSIADETRWKPAGHHVKMPLNL